MWSLVLDETGTLDASLSSYCFASKRRVDLNS